MNAYILAGGKSSRMGEDKGLCLLDGKPMIEHVIEAISPEVEAVILLTAQPGYQTFGLPLLADEMPGKGPMGGLLTAMRHSSGNGTSSVLLCACDMPLLPTSAVREMVQQSENQVSVGTYQAKVHPLFGKYPTALLPKIRENVEKNELKMMRLLEEVKAEEVDFSGCYPFDPFTNCNTPQALEQIQTYFN